MSPDQSSPRIRLVPAYEKMEATFLYYVRKSMILSGTLSPTMANINKSWYSVYGYIIQILYIVLVFFLYVEIPVLWHDTSKLIETVNVTLTYTVLVIKIFICKKNSFGNLLHEMVFMEDKLKATKDKNILQIYHSFVQRGKFIQTYYMIISFFGFFALLAPFFIQYIILWDEDANNLSKERPLPFFMWLPFDKNKHYIMGFSVNAYFAIITVLYYFTAQELLIILPLYISFRLQVLNNYLKTMKTYLHKTSKAEVEDVNDEDAEATIRFCVFDHLDIIRYTNVLNKHISSLMLLEFVLYSAQIALILFEIMSSKSVGLMVFAGIHLLLTVVQLLLLYWHANEIRINSEALSMALYETEWIHFNKRTKSIVRIMMMRAQKPLALTIGPLGEMSLRMALTILKGAYSYVTFLQSTYGDEGDLE